MTTGEIVSLIGLAISAAAFVTGSVVFFKNMGRDAADRGGRNAKLESKLDFIKIQTELIRYIIIHYSSIAVVSKARVDSLTKSWE